jgi:protein-tyrosine kinase
MSRFFETLKEVSRSQLLGDETLVSPETAGASDRIPVPEPPVQKKPPVARQAPSATPPPPVAKPVVPAEPPPATQPPAPEPSKIELPSLKLPDLASPEALFEAISPRRSVISGWKAVHVRIDEREPLIPNASGDMIVERYRRLRTKIQQQHATQALNSILVTSPAAGDGKTLTLLNLAWSFGMLASFKVLVVDGDMRKRMIGPALGVGSAPGLSNLLDGSAKLKDVILGAESLPFQFVLAGTSQTPPGELLNSPTLRESIREMTRHYDLVLVDSPPVNMVADAQMLAGTCDGVLLVARAFATTNKAFERTLADLLPFRIVGTVLNGGTPQERRSYYDKGYSRADG